jgi:putative DNA methylase
VTQAVAPKKLIEVALPLEAINEEGSRRKRKAPAGYPTTLHKWWAQRPVAAARAVIFAQMVDDPSAYVDTLRADPKLKRKAESELRARLKLWEEARELARTAKGTNLVVPEAGPRPTLDDMLADIERQRLFRIIEDLVLWENTTNETVLQAARDEIWQSWRRACAENVDHPRAKELFDRKKLPAFHDPFAGSGALPLEAQRLGLESYASDLNPVAVLINKAMIEIPPRFAGRPPVNPRSRSEWGEVRRERANELSGDHRLAEGDAGDPRDLSSGSASSAGRDIRHAIATDAGDGLGSGQHRGGVDPRNDSGQGELPGDRAGLARRSRDVADALRATRLVSGSRDHEREETDGRNQPNADSDASQPQGVISHSSRLFPRSYKGAQGLAEDIRYYGKWMRDEAEKRIGHLYPKVKVTAEDAEGRGDLERYVGKELTVIAWLWARTVKSPNPAFARVDVPLASTFMLSTKAGKEAYVEVVTEEEREKREADGSSHSSLLSARSSPYRFTVKVGKPKHAEGAKNGTKLSRGANFQCLMSGTPIAPQYIKDEGKAGRMGARLMAIVAEGDRGRVYLAPTPEHDAAALKAKPEWKPETPLPADMRSHWTPPYGLTTYGDLFTPRQLVALTTFSDLAQEARERVQRDALVAGLPDDAKPLRDGGTGATAYAEAVCSFLAMAVSRLADYGSSIATWRPKDSAMRSTMPKQGVQMAWDFAEGSPFGGSSSGFRECANVVAKVIDVALTGERRSTAEQANVRDEWVAVAQSAVVSTDPPYYDNIGYADLSDFFYVWLRRSLKPVFPALFATVAVPKEEELVATPHRHGGKGEAEAFFLEGMTQAMHRLAEHGHPAFPVTIYYAFKQAESDDDTGTASTGWDTFLAAVIEAGFSISGTWPMRTEGDNRSTGIGTNALASSIVLVCRPRAADAPTATRREFVTALKAELPEALAHLQRGNIAPVDLAQAAIGPGMAVYTRYARVLDAEGKPLSVREALALINQTLDEALAEQEGDFDADSRFSLAWFEQYGFAEGAFGVANVLAQAKNTGMNGLVQAGIIESKRGTVRLLRPEELPADWDPATDPRLTAWEIVHQLIRELASGGEGAAATLVAKLGAKAEIARELAYRLYTLCERKKRAVEALSYNSLVQSWPEIARLSRIHGLDEPSQPDLL